MAKAPVNLKKSGRRLWRSVTSEYGLRPDELAVLESACRLADAVADLDAELAECELESSRLPLLREVRQQREALRKHLAQLKLPEAVEGSSAGGNVRQIDRDRSARARRAARARWG
ncbi:hypothetical protein [Phytoactinopolyspora halophila]|nr:hypothetical protein [Phytoactinopolyspora halophila]